MITRLFSRIPSSHRRILSLIITSLLVFASAGCGGSQSRTVSSGGNRVATGRARFSVVWPKTDGRLIPVASKSIRVVLRNANGNLVSQPKLLPRPTDGGNTSMAEWADLPVGFLTATSDALPNTDGTGTIQASATAGVEIRSQEVSEVRLTMNSTIHEVRISPSSLGFPIEIGPHSLTATAYNEQGAVVLTANSKWHWSIAPAGIASLSATTGASTTVQGIGFGTATITATELESGKSGTASVTVRQGSRPEDGSGLAASSWPKYRGNVGNNAIAPNGTLGQPLWTASLPVSGNVVGAGSAAAINGDGSVVAVSGDFHLTVLDPATGEVRWRFAETTTYSDPACGKDGTIYFTGEGGFLYAVNGQNGAVRWKTLLAPDLSNPFDQLHGSPTIGSDGRIYISLDGRLHIVDALTGVKVGESTEGELRTVCPAMDTQGHLYIPGNDSSFYAYYADGTLKWKHSSGFASYDAACLGPDGNILTAADRDGKQSLSLLNASDGSIQWQVDLITHRFFNPIVGPNGRIYVIAHPLQHFSPTRLVALDYTTGDEVWSIEISPVRANLSWVAVNSKNEVFTTYSDGAGYGIYGVNGANGAILWEAAVGEAGARSCAFSSTGVLYSGSGTLVGKVYAIR